MGRNFWRDCIAAAFKTERNSSRRRLHIRHMIGLGQDMHTQVRRDSPQDTFEYAVTEHLRMSGVYWGLAAMDLLSDIQSMDCEGIAKWVMDCQHPSVRSRPSRTFKI